MEKATRLGNKWRSRPSFDGKLLTTGQWHETWTAEFKVGGGHLQVAKMVDGQLAGPVIRLGGGRLIDSCICTDNATVATACVRKEQGILLLFDVARGKAVRKAMPLPGVPISVAARPGHPQGRSSVSGRKVACRKIAMMGQLFWSWCIVRGRWNDPAHASNTRPMVLRSSSSCLKTAVVVRDADSGELRYPPIMPEGPLRSIDISDDSQLLATAVNDKNHVQVWDLQTGKPLGPQLPHPGDYMGIFSVQFSPDSRSILTAHRDHRVRYWDWKNGTLLCPPMQHLSGHFDAQFTPDGKYALSALGKGGIAVWDLATAKMVAPDVRNGVPRGFPHRAATCSIAVSGSRVVAAAGGHPVLNLQSLFKKPKTSIKSMQLLAELSSKRAIHLGEVKQLDQSQWTERWTEYKKSRRGAESEDRLLRVNDSL